MIDTSIRDAWLVVHGSWLMVAHASSINTHELITRLDSQNLRFLVFPFICWHVQHVRCNFLLTHSLKLLIRILNWFLILISVNELYF